MKLAFHKGAGLLSRLIEYGTHSEYSHVELLFEGDGRAFSARAERSPAVDIIVPDFSDGRWDFVQIPGRYSEAAARAWAEQQRGKGYDWAADFAFAIPHLPDDPAHKLICSGSCTAALQQTGLFREFRPDQVSPGQLYVMAMVLQEVAA